MTTDASVGAMASFLYALEVGERDFPELKRDQRWVQWEDGRVYMYICRWHDRLAPDRSDDASADPPYLTCAHT